MGATDVLSEPGLPLTPTWTAVEGTFSVKIFRGLLDFKGLRSGLAFRGRGRHVTFRGLELCSWNLGDQFVIIILLFGEVYLFVDDIWQ